MKYHFVWVTKNRYHMLEGAVGERVRDLVRQTCEAFEIQIISGVVSKDHVHIFVSAPATMAPSEIMRSIKGRSASKLFEEFPHIKKRYWDHHFCAKGYFCVTSGEVTDEMIQNYLKHHFEPDPNDIFKIDH
ncbi:MAG: IS200/IS605 family transposase [Proteobacteria bacterium]|nr:IS200/IS605 family transposase [Pseudomonadota bacterium]